MPRSHSLPRLLRRVAFWLLPPAAILQTVAMLVDYESATHYFRAGAVLPVLSVLLVLLSGLLGSLSILLWREELEQSPFAPHRTFSASTLGFLLAGSVLLKAGGSDTLRVAAGVLLLLSAPYAFLHALPRMREHRAAMTLLGLLPILACILLNAYYYFDVSIEMNSPIKLALQLALLPAMLAYTGEIRFHLGRPCRRLYLLADVWLMSLGVLSALSLPVAFLFGGLRRADYAVGAILLATLSLTQHRHTRRMSAKPLSDTEPKPSGETEFSTPDAEPKPSGETNLSAPDAEPKPSGETELSAPDAEPKSSEEASISRPDDTTENGI